MRTMLLFLLLLAVPAAATEDDARRVDLQRGLSALAARPPQPAYAYRLCRRVADVRGDQRAVALVCQGRAALLLKWPAMGQHLAQAALREPHYPPAALILLGDALRAQRKCAEARTVYLDALKSREGDDAAAAGLRACGGTVPDPEPPEPQPLSPASLAQRGRP